MSWLSLNKFIHHVQTSVGIVGGTRTNFFQHLRCCATHSYKFLALAFLIWYAIAKGMLPPWQTGYDLTLFPGTALPNPLALSQPVTKYGGKHTVRQRFVYLSAVSHCPLGYPHPRRWYRYRNHRLREGNL
jgi:hypothetical protein